MTTLENLTYSLKTRQQLVDEGLNSRGIKAACERQELRKLAYGIYISEQSYAVLKPWERYLLNVLVKFRASPHTVFSHQSAVALLGLAMPVQHDQKVHIYCSSKSRGSLQNVVRHPRLEETTPTYKIAQGITITAPLLTVIDCAQTLSYSNAMIVADSALNQRMCGLSELQQHMKNFSNYRSGKVHKVADALSAGSESPGETLTRLLLDDMGIRYIQQYQVGNYRADFFLPDFGVFIEFDGAFKYTDFGAYEDVLREERYRERNFLNSGARIFRTTWDEVYRRPEIFKQKLAQFLK